MSTACVVISAVVGVAGVVGSGLLWAVVKGGRDVHDHIAEYRRLRTPVPSSAPCRVSLAKQWCATHNSTLVSTCRAELTRLRGEIT